jgi:hypothetical protein
VAMFRKEKNAILIVYFITSVYLTNQLELSLGCFSGIPKAFGLQRGHISWSLS